MLLVTVQSLSAFDDVIRSNRHAPLARLRRLRTALRLRRRGGCLLLATLRLMCGLFGGTRCRTGRLLAGVRRIGLRRGLPCLLLAPLGGLLHLTV